MSARGARYSPSIISRSTLCPAGLVPPPGLRGIVALVTAGLLLLPSSLRAGGAIALGPLSAYGNFHAAGVVVTVSGDDDRNASATLEWRPAGGTFRLAQPLVRIDATHFVGSLFGLSPGTRYEARVNLSDPGGVQGASSGTIAFETRPDVLPPPTLRTLYVSPSGNDASAGTSAAPYRTIQRAADLAQAGDLILIRPGIYRESVRVRWSGTASQPIVFRGGAGVVLDGADAQIAAGVVWDAAGSGVYSRVLGFATDHVVSNLGRLYRYGSLTDLQALAAGSPGGFFFDGSRLHVKFADGGSPAGRTLHVARWEDGFLLDGVSYVRVEDVEIRHYGSAGYGKGVYLRYASNCVVRKSRIHEVESAGVWVKGGERHLIEDNEIWDTSIFGWPWPLVKGSRAENSAIRFSNEFGRGHVIRRNVVHGTFNGIVPAGDAGPASGLTNETDVHNNLLYEHTDDAFEPEGYGANLRFWQNRIQDVHMAFSVAPVAPGPVYILRNVAFRFGNTRTSKVDGYTASVLKINSGYSTPIGPLFLYHNTFLTDVPGTNAVSLMTPGSGTYIVARNNVFGGTRYVLEKSNTVALNWNGDDLHTTDATRFVKWDGGVGYNTLGALQSGTGQEAQGLSAPPLLTDPVRADFRPRSNSPLVNRALLLPGINDNYLGIAPDVGALEADNLPSVSIADVTVTEGNTGTVSASFRVSLSAPATATVTVDYASADGTATVNDGDYAGTSGTLTLAPGQTSTKVDVGVKGDTRVEPHETFFLQFANASGAILANVRAQAVIANDDSAPTAPTEPVVWTSAAGVSVSGNSLTKTAATAWSNAGAVSTKALASGDGFVEFTATEVNTYRILGLSNGDSNQNWDDIDFAIYPNADGTLRVYENKAFRGAFGTYVTGDKLRVSVSSGKVKYSRNGVVLFTSPTPPTYPLLVDSSLYSIGATLTNTVISGNWLATPPPPPPPPTAPVVWTSAAGVSVSGNSLTKTAATAWGNAGAVSTKALASGDGFVEFTTTEANTYRMLGLSNGDSNRNWDDIDFAIYPNADGTLRVYEKGVFRGTFGTYVTGDKLRVSVSSGKVKYSRNGVVLYTSAAAPTYPLLVDSSLYTIGAQLTNAVVSGNWVAPAPPPPPPPTTPSLSVGDASVTEGNAGTVSATFTVTLSAASSQTVTVSYATANGTATAGSDYVAQSGSLSFTAGQTMKTLAVLVNGDTTVESNETFLVNLSSPTNATLADSQGQGTINNDDTAPTPPPPPPPPPGSSGNPVILFTDVEAGPRRGGPGDLGVPIALFGKGFGAQRGTSTVTINGVEVARYLIWGQNNANNSALDMIVVQPGPNATAGPVVVRVNGLASNAEHSFTPTDGSIYYVSPTGSDSASCSESLPCATILNVATSRMKAADALLVRGGNLTDNEIWIREVLGHSGQPGRPKIIRNYPGEQPVFVKADRPFILNANYIVVSGLHFTGGKSINVGDVTNKGNRVINNTFRGVIAWDAVGAHGDDHLIAGNDCTVTSSTQGTQGHCYYISHSRNLRLLYNVGRGAPGYGIHIFDQRRSTTDHQRVIANVRVEGNLVASSPLRSGMIIAMADEGGLGNRVDGVMVRNNIFTGNNHMGLVLTGIVRNVQIYNNTFYKNGRQGIHVVDDPAVDGVDIRNNLIDQTVNSNCTSNCAWFQDAHIERGTRARNVTVSNNYYAPTPALLIGTTDSAPSAGLAGFVNGDGLDFHLRDGSPAIDTGATISVVPRDFDGRPRPQGSKQDPGAFEHP